MLTSLLDRLGTLLPRQFIVSYFVPALVFAFLNILLLAWQVPAFRAWAPAQLEGLKGLYALPVLIGLAVVAYLISSVSVYLRQVLEGRRLLPGPLVKEWTQIEDERRKQMFARLRVARDTYGELQRENSQSRKRLVDAGDKGNAAPSPGASYDESAPAAQSISALQEKLNSLELIGPSDVRTAVTQLEAVLATMDRDAETDEGRCLNADYVKLWQILEDAEDIAGVKFAAAVNDAERCFGVDELRPTRLGNIGAALDSYGATRYRMNLSACWGRMQLVLQEKKEVYGSLLDAKCQLEFLVVSCWFCMLTSAIWLVAIVWLPLSWLLAGVVLVLFPLGARFFYLLAVENYMVMADLIKSTVDLYRFDLLKSLHVPQPGSIRQERAVWAALGDLTSGKDGVEISYQHEAGAPRG